MGIGEDIEWKSEMQHYGAFHLHGQNGLALPFLSGFLF